MLEHPEMQMTTGADGLFSFDGLHEGQDVTLVLEHPDYPLIQTGTHTLPPGGIDDLTFQVPSKPIYDLLAQGGTILEPGAHGEAGVTVALAPELPAEHGPIYFNANVIPEKALTESSEDGGVLFVNAPPGEYVLSGAKAGATLGQVRFKCRAGVLVNASPPRGMNVL